MRDVLDREFDQDLSQTALAREVHLSPDHLTRCFREVFGETPHRYLQRRHVQRATYLLRTTRLDVTDVCLAVGFTSLGTFSSTFTRIVGVPPSAYARARRHTPEPAAPGCFTMAWTRPSTAITSVSRKREPLRTAQRRGGFMRWLTVRVPGDDREILLEAPGPPAHDPQTAEQVRELVTKGAGGGWIAFSVDDVDAVHAELVEKGVEITQAPSDQSYGRDMGIRDPFGNNLRIGHITA